MAKLTAPSRRTWESWLTNGAVVMVLLFAMIPIGTTILVSLKREADVTRNPPVIFPCDTPEKAFDVSRNVSRPLSAETSPTLIHITDKNNKLNNTSFLNLFSIAITQKKFLNK